MAGAGQKRGRRGIIGGYWGGYSLLSLSPTHRALPGKVENLTPPANGKNAPDGAPPAQAVPRWNVASWNRCARISASASSPAPERGADPRRPRYAPGCTRRSTTTPAQTKGQSSSAHRAACPGLFLLPIFQPCRLPDQHPGTRWVLSAAAPGKSWKVPGERWAQYLDIAPTTCTGMDQHRQRRTR